MSARRRASTTCAFCCGYPSAVGIDTSRCESPESDPYSATVTLFSMYGIVYPIKIPPRARKSAMRSSRANPFGAFPPSTHASTNTNQSSVQVSSRKSQV